MKKYKKEVCNVYSRYKSSLISNTHSQWDSNFHYQGIKFCNKLMFTTISRVDLGTEKFAMNRWENYHTAQWATPDENWLRLIGYTKS